MTLIRRRTNDMFPDWFEDFFTNQEFTPKTRTATVPSVNIYEKDDHFEIDMAIPGMKKEDIKINIDNELLTISAETESELSSEDENCTKKEFSYTNFSRSFTLPESVDKNEISAKSNDGVLKITVKKHEKATKAERQIEIE